MGLSKAIASKIFKETRPPIPEDVLIDILHESNRTCCICKDPNNPIIIHHIIKWEDSKDHGRKNLVVLCLNHHDDAHSKKELSLNLKAKQLIKHKEKWIEQCFQNTANTLVNNSSTEYGRWDYINLNRLAELKRKFNIVSPNDGLIFTLQASGVLDNHGNLCDTSKWKGIASPPSHHLYDFSEGYLLQAYHSSLLEEVIKKIQITKLNDYSTLRKGVSRIKPGRFFYHEGRYFFKDLTKAYTGRNQYKRMYYRAKKIRLESSVDGWECTSSTAKNDAMSGNSHVHTIGFARDYPIRRSGIMSVQFSCLAVGLNFDNEIIPPPKAIFFDLN